MNHEGRFLLSINEFKGGKISFICVKKKIQIKLQLYTTAESGEEICYHNFDLNVFLFFVYKKILLHFLSFH